MVYFEQIRSNKGASFLVSYSRFLGCSGQSEKSVSKLVIGRMQDCLCRMKHIEYLFLLCLIDIHKEKEVKRNTFFGVHSFPFCFVRRAANRTSLLFGFSVPDARDAQDTRECFKKYLSPSHIFYI